MSLAVTRWALYDAPVEPAPLVLVLVALSEAVGEQGCVRLDDRTRAAALRVSRLSSAGLDRAVDALIAAGQMRPCEHMLDLDGNLYDLTVVTDGRVVA